LELKTFTASKKDVSAVHLTIVETPGIRVPEQA